MNKLCYLPLLVAGAALQLGCNGCKKAGAGAPPPPSPRALADTPPKDFGATGLLLDGPLDGASVSGAWVTVSGWADPKRFVSVRVVGAPAEGFYEVAGAHPPLPTVPVLFRADGRFIAPRVPLAEGETQVGVYTLPPYPEAFTALRLNSSRATEVPATLIASPQPVRVGETLSLTPVSSRGDGDWQVDTDGDGVMDATVVNGAPLQVKPSRAGPLEVTARRAEGQGWVYATARVDVEVPPQITDSAEVGQPAAVSVVRDRAAWLSLWSGTLSSDGGMVTPVSTLAGDGQASYRYTRSVLVADGDSVQVFSSDLHPVMTLNGLSQPRGVAGDSAGRVYVADTGHSRIVRFGPDGMPDPAFGPGGEVRDLAKPGPLVLLDREDRGYELWVVDLGSDALFTCSSPTPTGAPTCTKSVRIGDGLDGDAQQVGSAPGVVTVSAVEPLFADELDEPADEGTIHERGLLVDSRGLLWFGPSSPRLKALPFHLASLSAGPAGAGGTTYAVGSDEDGLVREFLGPSWPSRAHRASFPVKGVAFDSLGSLALGYSHGGRLKNAAETGPLVVYVAGPGHLERWILPPLTPGIW